jgi:hypothetical protein
MVPLYCICQLVPIAGFHHAPLTGGVGVGVGDAVGFGDGFGDADGVGAGVGVGEGLTLLTTFITR